MKIQSLQNLRLYNTLARKKQLFKPLKKGFVGLYTCGPTVYDYAHIGNLRTYVFEDILRRTLEYGGYRVKQIMNITDVDDKTIKGAHTAAEPLKKFTKKYENLFKEDLKKLSIEFPNAFTRATEYIPEMIKLISVLLKKGYAYQKEGSVYFNISKFKKYGALAHLDKKGLKAGARVDVDEYQKNEAQDFVLWKGKKTGEPFWKAPFGLGRPGWHIECSAMSMENLGKSFDIHAAGVDLIFPHHENEIAQSEAATSKKFVKYWVHGELLLIDGKKMSKSLGNFYTLRDLEKKGFNTLAFRYLMLTAHYRSQLNFTRESLQAAENSLDRLYDFVRLLKTKPPQVVLKNLAVVLPNFKKAIFNDLDTPKALTIVWNLIHEYNKNPNTYSAKEILSLLYDFDKVLSLGFKNIKSAATPFEITQLAEKREEYRKNKNWAKADEVRNKIKKMGYLVEDTPTGSAIKKV